MIRPNPSQSTEDEFHAVKAGQGKSRLQIWVLADSWSVARGEVAGARMKQTFLKVNQSQSNPIARGRVRVGGGIAEDPSVNFLRANEPHRRGEFRSFASRHMLLISRNARNWLEFP
jgi:hypothetical protein